VPANPDPTVVAAIQAAALADAYPLAISLLREHDLTHLCVRCAAPSNFVCVFRYGDVHVQTCDACEEAFARWYSKVALPVVPLVINQRTG